MSAGLRGRLALRLLLLLLPFGIFVAWMAVVLRERAMVESTAENAVARMDETERAGCEAHPETWPHEPQFEGRRGRRRGTGPRVGRAGVEVVPYDGTLRSRRPGAPVFPRALAVELAGGASVASHGLGRGYRSVEEIAVAMPWHEGPCAVLLVRRPAERRIAAWTRALLLTLPVCAGAVALALLVVGPVVRRIRRLTLGVEGRAPLPDDASRDELGELARAFGESRRALDARLADVTARDETLRRYVASTTHDVMLPVTVLAGHLTDLERAARDGAPNDARLLGAALAEVDYLAALVANLGAAAKLDAGEPHLARHPTDLAALVERVHARHAPLARRRGVSLERAVPDVAPLAHADVTLLEQAVSNLVHNAVRYVPDGGHVAVVLESAAGRFTLRVLDDGPGVAPEELARLGERGFRGDGARSRGAPGSGLGLSIARDVAARHGYALTFPRPTTVGFLAEISGSLTTPPSR